VRRYRGCLGALTDDERDLLGLRAGLDGAPQSRSAAAEELGISTRRAAMLERQGLRILRSACGSYGSTAPGAGRSQTSTLTHTDGPTTDMPDLQPASYLAASDAPALESQDELGKKGEQEVAGETASSPDQDGGSGSGSDSDSGSGSADSPLMMVATGSLDNSGGAPAAGLWVTVAAMLAALVAFVLVTRRRQQPAPSVARATAAPVAPAPVTPVPAVAVPARTETRPAPVVEKPAEEKPVEHPPVVAWPQPAERPTAAATPQPAEPPTASTPQPAERPTSASTTKVTRRTGGLVGRASGIASLAARELKKRRGS
jgi:hypothetical protein